MADQETVQTSGNAWGEGIAESEMDRQRMGAGLGDTLDGKAVADMGRRSAEPPAAAGPEPSIAEFHRDSAGDVEDAQSTGAETDDIESQDTTASGSSGL